jgi:phosphohistidine phosphatase
MMLYLVRHGEATDGPEDSARGLTDRGFREVSRAADHVRARGTKVQAIYHSRKTRALQTAQIFSDHLKPVNGISGADGLTPMDDPGIWADRVAGMQDDIMLVGHLPYMGKLTGLLLCGNKDKTPVDFRTAGVACLQRFDDGHWTLDWMIMPDRVGPAEGKPDMK